SAAPGPLAVRLRHMALFSRRKKSADTSKPAPDAEVAPVEDTPVEGADGTTDANATDAAAEQTPVEDAPAVNISVQAFRGVGAQAGPEMSLPAEGEKP